MNNPPTISAEAFSLLSTNNQTAVIDVRSEGEYEKAHFDNTVNIPILSDALHQNGAVKASAIGEVIDQHKIAVI